MSMLKRSVFGGFVLLVLISVSHAACWLGKNKAGATHCQDSVDKTWHPVGSNWKNSQCANCWCAKDFFSCCDGWPTSTSEGCTIKYNYKACTYVIINVKNPGQPCNAIGK